MSFRVKTIKSKYNKTTSDKHESAAVVPLRRSSTAKVLPCSSEDDLQRFKKLADKTKSSSLLFTKRPFDKPLGRLGSKFFSKARLNDWNERDIVSQKIIDTSRGKGTNFEQWTIIPVNSSFRITWDFIQLFFLAYVCTCTPFIVAFFEHEEYKRHWSFYVDFAADVFYGVDILLNFRTSYIDERTGDAVQDGKKIATHYVKGWFFFDLLVTVPWDTIMLSESGAAVKVPRLLRILRLSRIAKLARIFKVDELMEYVEDQYNISRSYILVVKLVATIGLVAHLTACAFYFIATFEGNIETSWVADYKLLDAPQIEVYVASLYWAFTMMTTVGFGDIIPATHLERAFSIFAMLVSAGTYAFMIASMTSIVNNMNITKSMYFERLNELNAYMKARDLPSDLQLRTRKYYRYYLQRKTVHNEQNILNELPTKLREEITDHYIKATISTITFFQDIDRGFIANIAMHLSPIFFTPNSEIIKRDDVAHEMFIITKGVLQVYKYNNQSNQENVISMLYEGDHFGEMALLLEEQGGKRIASVRSVTYCELHGLGYKPLQLALSRYECAMAKLMQVAVSRRVLLSNLQRTKISNLIQSVQTKAIDKKFRKMAAMSRYGSDFPSIGKLQTPRG